MFGPNLQGGRVRLAAPTVEMLPTFVAWMSDVEVTRYLNRSEPPTLAQEQEWFDKVGKSETDLLWVILLGDKPIGTLALHQISWRARRAVTGTMLGDKAEWGKGYATEAQALRARYAFEELGLQKLKTEVFAENAASRRALEKGGYKQYGLARREHFRAGRWHDMWLAELLVEDWQGLTQAEA